MTPHLLVTQLQFARSELVRCLEGLSEEDGCRRLQPMNCISWMVGHLANQEHRYWVQAGQGQDLARWPNKLIWKVLTLVRKVSRSDFPPTTQQVEVHEMLKERITTYQKQLNELINKDLAAFNTLLKEMNIPSIIFMKSF